MNQDGDFYHPTPDTCYRIIKDTKDGIPITITYAGECYSGSLLGPTYFALTQTEADFQMMMAITTCVMFDNPVDVTYSWRDGV
jgi:hypothetical protein